MPKTNRSDSPVIYGNINLRVTEEERWAFKAWCAENRISQVDAFREAFALLRGARDAMGGLRPADAVDLIGSASSFMIDKARNLRIERRGDDAWAVCIDDHVANADGKVEYEQLPSVRDDAFIGRTRFNLEEALRIAKEFSC